MRDTFRGGHGMRTGRSGTVTSTLSCSRPSSTGISGSGDNAFRESRRIHDGSFTVYSRETQAAFHDAGITVISSNASDLDGQIIGRTAADKKVKITVKQQSEHVSKLSIRVGTFGDKALSQMIHKKIVEQLS